MTLYGDIIADQLKRGFIERVDVSNIPDKCHFIPHHPIKKESITTPLRIVYDCSCHQSTTQPSLNDCLQAGPPFINDMCAILTRFRANNIGIVTDIEKAFLHVHLAEGDRHFTYFVWLSKYNDPESEFIVYRFQSGTVWVSELSVHAWCCTVQVASHRWLRSCKEYPKEH